MSRTNGHKIAFLGTTEFSVIALDELKERGFKPSLIITTEDTTKNRGLVLTPPAVKTWAEKENIPYIQPTSLKGPEIVEEIKKYFTSQPELFVVFSYGKIIPQSVLDIPKLGTINLHPSLLPKLRGPSPIKSALLYENETGISIIRVDSEMDHGPILAQEKIEVPEWPPYENELENKLAHEGGKKLADVMTKVFDGTAEETEQNHSLATFSKMIEKADGEINLNDEPDMNLRKIRAYHVWPGAYYFENEGENKKRIIIKRARIEDGKLVIERVVPEGKKEMDYKDYLRGRK